jgi:hypothetical protein
MDENLRNKFYGKVANCEKWKMESKIRNVFVGSRSSMNMKKLLRVS